MYGNKFGNGRNFGNAKTVPKTIFCSCEIDNNSMIVPGFCTRFSENSVGPEVCFEVVISESVKGRWLRTNCVNQVLTVC